MYKLYCRIYQEIIKFFSPVLPWRQPILVDGDGCIKELADFIKTQNMDKLLIVADGEVSSLGIMGTLLKGLQKLNIEFFIYDDTVSNPTIENVEEALEIYKNNSCQGVIAFGGGSIIDCAKGVCARVANPSKSISDMKGYLKVRKRIPMLIAVPTTSGSGSEATAATVIRDDKARVKYILGDMALIPNVTMLDPRLTVNLPPSITASSGMGALTQAVEAYIGRSNTTDTWKFSRSAIKLIFENLQDAYVKGTNIDAREKIQRAAFQSGMAINKAYVGYANAISHALGGFYSVSHSQTSAIILPYVLEWYGVDAEKSLSELADLTGVCNSDDIQEEKAAKFINEIRVMNKALSIPDKIKELSETDIPVLAKNAMLEGNPMYPVPKIMLLEDFISIFEKIKL
ncbi:MAG: iron-containing alcohol dehydrogenase [Eubacteriales bacterium]